MQRIVNNEMVAHLWANQSQERAANANRSFYFKGKTLFSYGEHFKVAKFVEHNGITAVLFNNDTYSVTTSRHQSLARRALTGHWIKQFTVDVVDTTKEAHSKNKERWKEAINGLIKLASRARANALYYTEQAQMLALEANEYSKFFGLRWKITTPELTPEFLANVKEIEKRHQQRKKARAEKAEKQRLIDAAESTQKWRNLEIDHIPYSLRGSFALLRIKGDIVETSHGANVPVTHAQRLWHVIKRCKESGTTYIKNGHSVRVGQFVVNRIESNGDMVVGCHNFKFEELESLSKRLF